PSLASHATRTPSSIVSLILGISTAIAMSVVSCPLSVDGGARTVPRPHGPRTTDHGLLDVEHPLRCGDHLVDGRHPGLDEVLGVGGRGVLGGDAGDGGVEVVEAAVVH